MTSLSQFQGHSVSLAWETKKLFQNYQMRDNLSLKSDQVSKWFISACAEDTEGFRFNFKMFLRNFCSWDQSFISQYFKWFWNHKKLFCFSKVTDTRNLALLKPAKFQNLGDVTQLSIKRFPQTILQWDFRMIVCKDLGFQPQ